MVDESKRNCLIVTEVTPWGWVAQLNGMSIYFNNCGMTDGRMPKVGDVIGFMGEGGISFNQAICGSPGGTYGARACYEPTAITPRSRVTKAKSEKPYLAMNQSPWQKRKKGR